ncbi:class I SAM-dependent methyltransferase [Mesotoga sp. H07.pep.5.3]|uniref:class I SAM-dependent methyltransferase n=1 Tax=Mesotoga sp. H07.pep.5.3 TaxID=1421003 RepID=UPI000C17E09B|nr:methyltransferase [Mesotoga sp. H07.pep.5.3]PIJ62545.1 SAM-dependent methyltransferase [Mesotoga sp. H07.pep.5.3]
MKEDFQHYYTDQTEPPKSIRPVYLRLRNGHSYTFRSPEGVFAFGKADRASLLLIENCILEGQESILDLGCGYGVVGITLKLEQPDLNLHMSDVNTRALTFSKINARDHNILADIRKGDLFSPWEGTSFDSILSNPPIAAGKAVWQRMIREAPEFLNEGGSLQIVAYHNKGGSRLEGIMRETFGNVITTTKSGGVRVYVSRKL